MMHHPDQTEQPIQGPRVVLPRPVQCLRHHKWMAACADCREARAPGSRAAAPR
jgi:hypothetical protein